MITITAVDVTASISNPDTSAIQQKQMIDITLNPFDITASGYSEKIKLNYSNSEIVLISDEASEKFDIYFTPIYTETLSYQQWKTQINKSFQELEIE
jgi:hypothetical protein